MEYTEKEEKKAIKDLKSFLKFLEETYITKGKIYLHIEVLVYNRKNLDIILNLLKKQQKEIEELKGITQSYNSFVAQVSIPKNQIVVVGDKRYFDCGYFIERYIPKEVIREKIEELQEELKSHEEMELGILRHDLIFATKERIRALKELLGE